MARVVVVLACLLACQAALSTAQNADKASKHISNAIQGPSVAVDAVPARQKDAAAPAVQPVKGPQLATKNKTAGPAAEVLEVESMISGDVIEDSSSTAPDVKSMGGSSTAVGPTARRKAAAIQTASAVDKISSKLPPVTVSISSKKQAPSSSKQEGKSSKHKASLKAQKGEEGEEEEQQPEGESDDNKSGSSSSSSSSDHDAGNDAADSDAGSGSSSGVSHKAVKGKKGKHKQVAGECHMPPTLPAPKHIFPHASTGHNHHHWVAAAALYKPNSGTRVCNQPQPPPPPECPCRSKTRLTWHTVQAHRAFPLQHALVLVSCITLLPSPLCVTGGVPCCCCCCCCCRLPPVAPLSPRPGPHQPRPPSSPQHILRTHRG